MKTAKHERIELRVTPQQKRLLQRAAQLEGVNMTDFVLQNIQRKARRVIREHHTLNISVRDAELFLRAAAESDGPTPAMVELVAYANQRMAGLDVPPPGPDVV